MVLTVLTDYQGSMANSFHWLLALLVAVVSLLHIAQVQSF